MEVYMSDLVVGRQYRIEHKDRRTEPRDRTLSRLGTFVKSNRYFDIIVCDFNNIIMSDGKKEQPATLAAYCPYTWRFYESGRSLLMEQVARGLCDRIPEDVAGVIERFLTAKARMVDRYPQRSK
jgi:hypothetical protein